MALTVNGESHPHRDGLTIGALLEEKRFSYPLKTVTVNGRRVERDAYDETELADGDEIQVLHLMSGG